MSDVDAADMGHLRALATAGADFYQNGQVLMRAVNSPKDSSEMLSFVLCCNSYNDRYIEAVQTNGQPYASYLISVANNKNNKNAAMAIKDRLNYNLVQDAEAGNLPRVQALFGLGSGLIDLKYKRADGHTALMVAVINRRAEVVSFLVDNGADVTQVNSDNKSVRDLCGNDVRIAAMLDKVTMANDLREQIKNDGENLTPEKIGEFLDKGVQVNFNFECVLNLANTFYPLSVVFLRSYGIIPLSSTIPCNPLLPPPSSIHILFIVTCYPLTT